FAPRSPRPPSLISQWRLVSDTCRFAPAGRAAATDSPSCTRAGSAAGAEPRLLSMGRLSSFAVECSQDFFLPRIATEGRTRRNDSARFAMTTVGLHRKAIARDDARRLFRA